MPAFQAEPGMPYWIDLASSDLRKSSHFYAQVLGWDIEEVEGGYRIARLQGLPVAGFVQRPEDDNQPDTWITYFQSAAIADDCARAVELGGRVLVEPTSVYLGQLAVLVDTAGGMFGLIQPAGEDSFIAAGEPGTPVWHEFTATVSYDDAVSFYEQLFDWVTATTDAQDYTTALVDGAAFAGIFNATGKFPLHVPSFWQSFLGVLDVADAVAKTRELGGDVIREPFDSGFGKMAIIADSTGATVTLCEVLPPVEEGRESDPLEGFDLPL